MPHALTLSIVRLAGLYLVTLGVVAMLAPRRAASFLLGFARTARTHYLELAVRGIVGGAFVLHVPRPPFASAFALFGWMLLLTTAALGVLPWRWHQAFARRAVPHAARHLTLVGVASLVLGGAILAAACAGGVR